MYGSNQYSGNNYPNDFENENVNQTQGVYSGYQSAPQIPQEPPKKKKGSGVWKKLAVGAGVGLCFGIFAGTGFYAVQSVTGMLSGSTSTEAVSQGAAVQNVSPENNVITTNNSVTTVTTDVTGVVEKVMPSVVSITNVYTEESNFFGQKLESQNQASGSGIIVGENDTELLVVTNAHVISDADTLSVQFIDGEQAQAQVKGYDSDKDLAVIAVPLDQIGSTTKDSISIATLGDSDSLTVGEPVIAIGNALGYGQSVTTGVVSALNRELEGTNNKLIQTDAAINPGNSGGALVNINGEVIGINSNKIGGTAVEGMGYAIPISSAKPIIEDLMTKTTKVKVAEGEKAYLGISGVNVTEEVSQMYGMPKGVYVGQVYEGTAAQKAGLVKGDIITKFDGSSVASMEELQKMMEYYPAGSEVEITIQQGSPNGYQEKKVTVVLGAKEEAQQQ
ncbi:MAG: trypsin-like peptidase domain-containing protein [Lachnospiraceae bacterium]|nr:trypsin-like peptidase domain-containing protein [Lachnospiraceae bacterium]